MISVNENGQNGKFSLFYLH
eukprot:UN21241